MMILQHFRRLTPYLRRKTTRCGAKIRRAAELSGLTVSTRQPDVRHNPGFAGPRSGSKVCGRRSEASQMAGSGHLEPASGCHRIRDGSHFRPRGARRCLRRISPRPPVVIMSSRLYPISPARHDFLHPCLRRKSDRRELDRREDRRACLYPEDSTIVRRIIGLWAASFCSFWAPTSLHQSPTNTTYWDSLVARYHAPGASGCFGNACREGGSPGVRPAANTWKEPQEKGYDLDRRGSL